MQKIIKATGLEMSKPKKDDKIIFMTFVSTCSTLLSLSIHVWKK